MSYQTSEIITAADINGFLDTINHVYGVGYADRGYGQTAFSQNAVTVGDAVRGSHWNNLRSMALVCANHQATNVANFPPSDVFVVGQPITAYFTPLSTWLFSAEQNSANDALSGLIALDESYVLPNYVAEIDANRFNASPISLSATTNVWTATRDTPWFATITVEVSALWESEDRARYYFNSGGQIRLRCSHPTGTAYDNIWHDILRRLGTVSFGAHATGSSEMSSSAIGYYELSDSYRSIYANDSVVISAKCLINDGVRGGNGLGVQFRIVLTDVGSEVFASGGTSFTFDNIKASRFLTGIIAPAYATITGKSWEFKADVNGGGEALGGTNSWEFKADMNSGDEALGGAL